MVGRISVTFRDEVSDAMAAVPILSPMRAAMEQDRNFKFPLARHHPVPLISLCSTNYNTNRVALRSLESVLRHSDGLDREVVIVDNFSTDGSYEALSTYRGSAPLRLLRCHCSRGLGRQLAFQRSSGEYIVTFDLDTIYNSNWGQLVRWAVANQLSFELEAVLCQIFPRSVIEQVGGWRDLLSWEDLDLSIRLAAKGLYRDYPLVCGDNQKRRLTTNAGSRWLRFYRNYRDSIAIRCWIPLKLYLRGYAALRRRDRNALFFLSVFAPAFLAGLRKRKHFGDVYDYFSICMNPSVRVDCGIVPPEELRYAWRYGTRAICENALNEGDLEFLPSTYE